MEIRHVEISEQKILFATHPQLAELRPDLVRPALPDNPSPVDPDFPYLFYALADHRVVGHVMSFPDTLFSESGGRSFRWAWNLGLYTDAEYRGRGIAQRMVEYQLQEFER